MSTLEISRQAYEDIEIYERAIAKQLDKKPKTTKQQVSQQHHIRNLIDRIQAQSQLVIDSTIKDEDESFKDELEAMKGQNAFGSFYSRLKETRDYHMRFPNTEVRHAPPVDAEMACRAEFSGEEVFGKYVDLHAFHERSLNMKAQFGNNPKEYADYLDTFYKLDQVSRKAKNGKYSAYVSDLREYLVSFLQRTNPLVDIGTAMAKDCVEPFEAAWAKGGVPGWGAVSVTSGGAAARGKALDLSHMHSAAEVEALGMSRIAEGCVFLGLKAGGSLKDRAARLFSTKGVDPSDFPAKIRAPKAAKGGGAEADGKRKQGSEKAMAEAEACIAFLVEGLSGVLEATKKHVEKKHTMLLEERNAELAEEESDKEEDEGAESEEEDEEEDEEDDAPLYNPLNLPLGWDGKPIPYWLYKLHGLGVEYKCEICGNASYYGRRAFDRHFQEWRHAYGMRCLGIPNTKHFHDITLIEDATALHSKLKDTIAVELFDAAAEEEYEDSEGHVLNRRTYEDLARQGLL